MTLTLIPFLPLSSRPWEENDHLFSTFYDRISLSTPCTLCPPCRRRSFSLLTPGCIYFLSSSTLFSPFEHPPFLLSLSFKLKICAQLPNSEKLFFTLCSHLKILLSTLLLYQLLRILGFSNIFMHVNHLGNAVSMQTDSMRTQETAFLMSTQVTSMLEASQFLHI